MNARRITVVAVASGPLFLFSPGCGRREVAPVAASEAAPVVGSWTKNDEQPHDATRNDSRFEKRLLEIASEYREQYALDVDGIQWAPEFCLPPPISISDVTSDRAHGQKLYYLFVKRLASYADAAKKSQPVGQAIVKQSWVPREAKGDDTVTTAYVERDGKKYVPDRPADLFVMFKEAPETRGTDRGWIYGTVTPDLKQVTSVGRIASCMECHEQAQPDRVFGTKRVADSASR